jgi:hypothetical protein
MKSVEDLKQLIPELSEDFANLKGAVIQNVGFDEQCSEGGLGIDYIKDGIESRLVLGFNNLGMWVYNNTQKDLINIEDEIRKKIRFFIDSCSDHTHLACEQFPLDRKISIVGPNARLELTLTELSFLPRDIVNHIRNPKKDPNKFIFSLQVSDWLFVGSDSNE